MTHTQNTPPDNATDSKVADFWELRPQRVEPQYVGKHRAEQSIIEAPEVAWWVYLICILGTVATIVALVWLYSVAPIGGVR